MKQEQLTKAKLREVIEAVTYFRDDASHDDTYASRDSGVGLRPNSLKYTLLTSALRKLGYKR